MEDQKKNPFEGLSLSDLEIKCEEYCEAHRAAREAARIANDGEAKARSASAASAAYSAYSAYSAVSAADRQTCKIIRQYISWKDLKLELKDSQ